MTRILLTGFTPFAGRRVNASWVAAVYLQKQLTSIKTHAIELPVEWGKPLPILDKQLAHFKPDIVVAMGEGKPGCFQLETLAVNQRADKEDNSGLLPPTGKMVIDGPESLKNDAPLGKIRELMQRRGIPVLLSMDAGGFLCEETLFALQYLQKGHISLSWAVFLHLPPFGTTLQFKERNRVCDHELLLEFAQDFGEIVLLV